MKINVDGVLRDMTAEEEAEFNSRNEQFDASAFLDLTSIATSLKNDFVSPSDLDIKQDKLTAGRNISIKDNVISSIPVTYSFGSGLATDEDNVSIDYAVVESRVSRDLGPIVTTSTAVINEIPVWADATKTLRSSGYKLSDFCRKTELADVSLSGSYNDLTDKPIIPEMPTIPTKLSSFANDTNFITLEDLPIYDGSVE